MYIFKSIKILTGLIKGTGKFSFDTLEGIDLCVYLFLLVIDLKNQSQMR